MRWMIFIGALLPFLYLSYLAAAALGARQWIGAVSLLADNLQSGALPSDSRRYTSHVRGELPAPVRRYFRTVLRTGQPLVKAATIDLVGTFNMSATGDRWKHFSSRQEVVTRRPGFLWDARVAMFFGINVRVSDSYIRGRGQLRAAVLGLFTVAEAQGDGEIARGELMRWFAEAAWYPTALLPGPGVRWEAVDDNHANATIEDGSVAVTLLFGFDSAGLITTVRAAARGASVGKNMVMRPWECTLSNYQWWQGMLLPMTGEAAWIQPQGRRPYFKATVSNIALGFAS